MKKDVRLYNVLFPLWMLLLFPVTWIVVIPGNFIIDSIVLIVAMSILHFENKKEFYKRNIVKIFGVGIVSDLIGSVYMLVMMIVFELGSMGDEWYTTVPALLIASVLIYIMNYYISFKECDKKLRIKLALTFAIATAPYTFLIPSRWLYNY
ncbi:MAG: hypothetical protein E7410_04855 [Ruminococcaceae bacterium]|nr:hypothetical protein [Oscillospiraceae bacterium]